MLHSHNWLSDEAFKQFARGGGTKPTVFSHMSPAAAVITTACSQYQHCLDSSW